MQEVLQSKVERVSIEKLDVSLMHLDWITAALAEAPALKRLDIDIEVDHAPSLTGPFQVRRHVATVKFM